MNRLISLIESNRLYVYTSLAIFVLLNLSYVFDISVNFKISYIPFLFEFDTIRFVSVTFFSLLITLVGSFIRNDFIKLIWYILLIMQYYSSAILFTYLPDISFYIVIQNMVLLIAIFLADFIEIKKISLPEISLANNIKVIFLLSAILFIPFVYYYWSYVSFDNLLLDKNQIYETRDLFRNINIPILGYLMSPLSRVLFPILIIYSISSKKYYILIISVMAIAYLFLCSATKSVLIGGIIAVFFYYGKHWKDKFKLFSFMIISLIILGFIMSFFFNSNMVTGAFIRRVFFIPPSLDNIYYQYFNDNFSLWAHSPFGSFFSEIDLNNKDLTMFIGEDIMGFKGLNANIGILTEGFISFGYIGLILHAAIYGFVFVIIRNLNISPHYFGIVFAYIFYLNSSLLSTLLLTHGLVFLLIIFTFFLRNSADE